MAIKVVSCEDLFHRALSHTGSKDGETAGDGSTGVRWLLKPLDGRAGK